MKVEFSKAFIKASKRLSGKMLDSLRHTIAEVKAAKDIPPSHINHISKFFFEHE